MARVEIWQRGRSYNFKMASRGRMFTAEEVAEICAQSGNEGESDIDSETGGMSSLEEFELDEQLLNESEQEADLRFAKYSNTLATGSASGGHAGVTKSFLRKLKIFT